MICSICQEDFDSLDEHHIIPQSLGGKNLGTIKLCSNCHTLIHNQALAMIRGKEPDLTDIVAQRAYPLAQCIVKVTLVLKQTPNKPVDSVVNVRISIHPSERELWHEAKRMEGFSNLENYIRHVVSSHVLRTLEIDGT